jgi:uncharacterized protein (TIGR02217 family)
MERFIDTYIDGTIRRWPCISTPRFATDIVTSDSGAEFPNRKWQHPLYKYSLPEAISKHEDYEKVRDHWLVMGGPAHTFPWRDPLDFASCALRKPNVVPAVTFLDQTLGSGDGAKSQFQLQKTYTRGATNYVRPITLPVVSSVVVSVDGDDPSALFIPLTWSVSRTTGIIQFSGPVPIGLEVRAGFLFDVEVRFENDDSFDGIAKDYGLSGNADVTLVSVRGC